MLQCWSQMPNECRDGNEMCRCICGHNPFTALMHKEGCRSLLPPCLSEICSQTAFLVMEDKNLLKDETWRKMASQKKRENAQSSSQKSDETLDATLTCQYHEKNWIRAMNFSLLKFVGKQSVLYWDKDKIRWVKNCDEVDQIKSETFSLALVTWVSLYHNFIAE